MRARQHIDRIDLDQADPVEHPLQLRLARRGASAIAEPLRQQRDAPGLHLGEGFDGGCHGVVLGALGAGG